MFLENKYTKWYFNIINRAKARLILPTEYTEKHHIIPRSCGGSNSKDNLVALTAREHFICHLLLIKMLSGNLQYKMSFALNRMLTSSKNHNRYTPSSRFYDISRKYRSIAISATHKGIPESAESNIKRSLATKGIPRGPKTEEHRSKLSMSKKGIPSKRKGIPSGKKGMSYEDLFGEEKANLLKQEKSKKLKGRTFSKETKEMWSKSRKGKNTGGNNPNAIQITVNGITYSSKKDACQQLGISSYKLKQLIS